MIFAQPAVPDFSVTHAQEGDLVIAACGGDVPACDELARRHRKAAFLLALQLLGNRDDALDVAQDAMLRFFSTLHRFDPRRPVRPWLYQIVRNRVHDLRRRQRVRRHDSIDEVNTDGTQRFEITDLKVDLHRDAARSQLRTALWQALGELSENQREILVLRDYQDLSYREIAQALDIPIGTVMSRLHAARKRLRAVLRDDLKNLMH